MMTRRLLAMFLVALIGLVAGAYAPLDTSAEYRHISFGPPTEYDNNYSLLYEWPWGSPWHGPDGWSLDWDPVGGEQGNLTVYSRAWATSGDGQPTVRAFGTPEIRVPYGYCQNVVWLDIWDTDNPWRWLASVGFVHTHEPQFSWIDYYFDSDEEFNPGIPVSNMITFPDTCDWDGVHVHETHHPGGDASKIINWEHYQYGGGGYYWNTDGNNWTRDFGW